MGTQLVVRFQMFSHKSVCLFHMSLFSKKGSGGSVIRLHAGSALRARGCLQAWLLGRLRTPIGRSVRATATTLLSCNKIRAGLPLKFPSGCGWKPQLPADVARRRKRRKSHFQNSLNKNHLKLVCVCLYVHFYSPACMLAEEVLCKTRGSLSCVYEARPLNAE